MKDSIQKQLQALTTRYGWLPAFIIKNMRLLLLVLFALMAGYLVNRVNTLVNSDEAPQFTATSTDEGAADSTPANTISKTPDADVLSTFNELSVQEVELDSSFEDSRENPF